MTLQDDYQRLRAFATATNQKVGMAIFYREHQREIEISKSLFTNGFFAKKALTIISEIELSAGHGTEHARQVALDAGAIVIIESGEDDLVGLPAEVALAHLAGLLHDVCRGEADHARQGAEAAARILAGFPIDEVSAQRVVKAIAAHEAFQEQTWDEIGDDSLLANALYDADKFRWGADNFTTTLWEMLSVSGYPLEKLLMRWERGMEGIERVRNSFRSNTGKLYGPDFIDRGIVIGTAVYDLLRQEYGVVAADLFRHR